MTVRSATGELVLVGLEDAATGGETAGRPPEGRDSQGLDGGLWVLALTLLQLVGGAR